jgi:hypothetical protein
MEKTPDTCFYRLVQLANLGLPSQIFIPALLEELHNNLRSLANTFCWQNDEGELSNIYDESHSNNIIESFITAMSSDKADKYARKTNWINQLQRPTTTVEYYKKILI